MKQGKILLTAAFLTAVFCLAMNALAYAEDCPPGVSSCKIVVMSPQEIQSLEGAGLIFDSAEWANRANLAAAIAAWKQKIASSPDGKVPAPPIKEDKPKK
jgi:hypothetical protein